MVVKVKKTHAENQFRYMCQLMNRNVRTEVNMLHDMIQLVVFSKLITVIIL